MKRFALWSLAAAFMLIAGCSEKTPERPNIIMFFTDDNGFEYWGFSGGPDLSPNIDAIAAEGVTAENAYISASVCTPSRYSLHTGKFAGRCRHPEFLETFPDSVPYNITWNTYLDPTIESTLGELLREGGYTTGFVGKWHLGWDRQKFSFNANDDPKDPEVDRKLKAFEEEAKRVIMEAGFDYAGSVTPINIDNHQVKAVRYHNLEWLAKGANDFLDKVDGNDEPFFLIVNITTHHGPCHIASIEQPVNLTPEGYVDGLEDVMPPRESIFERIEEKGYPVDFKTAGSVWTDDCVGAVLDKLQQIGKDDEALVIFTTDHNRYDGKATCYEGGVKIPFIARYPGKIEAGKRMETKFQLTDMLPTFLDAGHIPMPEDLDIDGISIWKQITGTSGAEVHDDLYFEFGYSRGVLHNNWKYISVRFPDELTRNMKNGKVDRAYALRGAVTDEPCFDRYPAYFDADQLYNLETDPDEQHNLAYDPDYAEQLKAMQERLWNILATFDHPFPEVADPFYRSEAYEQLVENARTQNNMEQFYWYVQGCY